MLLNVFITFLASVLAGVIANFFYDFIRKRRDSRKKEKNGSSREQ